MCFLCVQVGGSNNSVLVLTMFGSWSLNEEPWLTNGELGFHEGW